MIDMYKVKTKQEEQKLHNNIEHIFKQKQHQLKVMKHRPTPKKIKAHILKHQKEYKKTYLPDCYVKILKYINDSKSKHAKKYINNHQYAVSNLQNLKWIKIHNTFVTNIKDGKSNTHKVKDIELTKLGKYIIKIIKPVTSYVADGSEGMLILSIIILSLIGISCVFNWSIALMLLNIFNITMLISDTIQNLIKKIFKYYYKGRTLNMYNTMLTLNKVLTPKEWSYEEHTLHHVITKYKANNKFLD